MDRSFKEIVHQMIYCKEQETVSAKCPEEEMSITEILKDLEVILEKELENNSSSDIGNLSGFGPENETDDKMLPLDYNKHQVWHYPAPTSLSPIKEETILTPSYDPSLNCETNAQGIFGLQELRKILSPVENNHKGAVKYISASAYKRMTGDKLHSMHQFHLKAQISKRKNVDIFSKPPSFECSEFSDEPFCSSPCDEKEMDTIYKYENRFANTLHNGSPVSNESPTIGNSQSVQVNQSLDNATDFLDWSSLDTDSTIEQPTILAIESPI
ncbi:uncharacterized protein LOC134585350 [Pelobates fuscus]|uniref:uncharacterized protein LOC134585350 n=1 Tax=Pelobates fuscus TaxID=191477 RepID=UPI002FE45C27